jgi:hypothetical protein
MNRVVILKPVVGLCYCQVCAVDDANDDEILEVCNRENPSGTSAGWCEVIHEPVRCIDDPDRVHLLVAC